jgi:DNA-nicking Smr family endonuclease
MTKSKSPKRRAFSNRPLKGLSRLKKSAPVRRVEVKPVEEPAPAPADDDELFAQAMSGVTPMDAHDESLPPEPILKTSRPREEQEEAEVMQALRDLVTGEAPLSIQQTDEAIEGSIGGLDPRIMGKLRRGEFSVQEHLDLHGFTRGEAREKVESFLLDAIAQGKRCVLIIHGRGLGSKDRIPVLKNALKSWLQRRALRKKILAFATARACDGGAGAVYVLLKTYRPRTR